MIAKYKITATIVLFNENVITLKKTIDSFLNISFKKKLYLIDNSATNILEKHFLHEDIEYIFVGKNLGFGKAHNLVLDKLNSHYHIILNPDVEFNEFIIPVLVKQLELNDDVAFCSPKVVYPDKELQYICRKHPTFFDLLNRKLNLIKNKVYENEYRGIGLNKAFFPDFIHGCFMFFKTESFKDLNGFDERFFLYMEDADICRKIDNLGKKKLYYPDIEIIHQHQKGSSKSAKLFFHHISSAFKYFLKWGF